MEQQHNPQADPLPPALPHTPKPAGPILRLQSSPQSVWIAPERLRSPSGIDGWIESVREFAAVDAILVRLLSDTTVPAGGAFHVAIPGDDIRYVPFAFDHSEKYPIGRQIKLPTGSTLLLHKTTSTARFFILKQETGEERSGVFKELLAARVDAQYITDQELPKGESA